MVPTANSPLKKIPVGEVLRLLFTDAQARIAEAQQPKFKKRRALSPFLRRLRTEHRRAARTKARIEKRFRKAGYWLNSTSQPVTDSAYETKQKRAWQTQQTAKPRRLKELRISAHLDLIGLSVEGTRAYLKALRTKLEALR